jgi:hypothetical protein
MSHTGIVEIVVVAIIVIFAVRFFMKRGVFFYVFQGRGDDGWIGGNGSAADVTITNGHNCWSGSNTSPTFKTAGLRLYYGHCQRILPLCGSSLPLRCIRP